MLGVPTMMSIDSKRFVVSIDKEAVWIFTLFILSLINATMLLISTIVLLLYLLAKNSLAVGATKGLIFIAIRTIVNTGIAIGYDSIGTIKWIIIFSLSLIIILSSISKSANYNKSFIWLLFLLFCYIIFDSLLFSGYPTVSIFKAISWAFVFCAVVMAVVKNPEIEWIEHISNYLNIVLMVSPLALLLGVAYLRNGHAFQGVTNHPNMFGIIVALTFALNIHLMQKRFNVFRVIMLILSIVFGVMSESRTGMLCIVVCFVTYIWFSSISSWKKITLTILTILIVIIGFLMGLGEPLLDFVYKGQDIGGLLYSREGQISRAITKYENNKWFGSGFMVPFNSGYQSFSFSFELNVEPGNIIIALLGDIGIVGTFLFVIAFGNLFYKMDKQNIILYLMPLVASMGEMMFFSTNNIAVLFYVFYGVCIARTNKSQEHIRGIVVYDTKEKNY